MDRSTQATLCIYNTLIRVSRLHTICHAHQAKISTTFEQQVRMTLKVNRHKCPWAR